MENKHCRHAVYCGTFFHLNRVHNLNRIEVVDQHHCCRMGIRRHYAKHAAKAMEQRNRNTQNIIVRKLHTIPDCHAVINQIIVRQHNALSGNPVVPDVYCILMTSWMSSSFFLASSSSCDTRSAKEKISSHKNIPGCLSSSRKITFFRNGGFSERVRRAYCPLSSGQRPLIWST